MSIVCAKCGGTHVTCEALVLANKKEFIEFTDGAFHEGYCHHCQKNVPLVDEEEQLNAMDGLFFGYHNKHGLDPMYVHCSVYYVDEDNLIKDAYIRLKQDVEDDRPDELEVECQALGVGELKGLAIDNCYGFTIVEIYSMFSIVNGERVY